MPLAIQRKKDEADSQWDIWLSYLKFKNPISIFIRKETQEFFISSKDLWEMV